jgi:hypothetical protein
VVSGWHIVSEINAYKGRSTITEERDKKREKEKELNESVYDSLSDY